MDKLQKIGDQIAVTAPHLQMTVAYHDFADDTGKATDRDYIMISVQGTDELGYVGFVEEWASPNSSGGYAPDIYLVLHETDIVESAGLAFELAVRAAANSIDSEYVPLFDLDLLLKAVKL